MKTPSVSGLCVLLAGLAVAQPTGTTTDEARVYFGRPEHEPALVYRFTPSPFKPFVEVLRSPSGINILRDAPSDHRHHHGLMFAARVDGVNFWEESDSPGKQQTRREVSIMSPGRVRHYLTATVDWVDPKVDKALVVEERTIELYQDGDLEATLATWQSRFTPPEGKADATFTGTNYHGLGMRFLESMDKGGRHFNSDGTPPVLNANDVRSKWTAYTAPADGKTVTVAMFDHPDNPRSPARWFTMDSPFAYVSASLGLDREPLIVTPQSPLLVRYGIAVWDGEAKPSDVEKLYGRWLEIVDDPRWRSL